MIIVDKDNDHLLIKTKGIRTLKSLKVPGAPVCAVTPMVFLAVGCAVSVEVPWAPLSGVTPVASLTRCAISSAEVGIVEAFAVRCAAAGGISGLVPLRLGMTALRPIRIESALAKVCSGRGRVGSFGDGVFGPDGLPFDGHPSATLLRLSRGLDISEVNERETARITSDPVIDEFDVFDVTESAEDVGDRRLLRRRRQIEDADAGGLLGVHSVAIVPTSIGKRGPGSCALIFGASRRSSCRVLRPRTVSVVISPLLLRLQGVGEFKEQSLLSYSQLVLLGEGFDVGFSEDFQRRVAVDVLLLESVDRPIRESSILQLFHKFLSSQGRFECVSHRFGRLD